MYPSNPYRLRTNIIFCRGFPIGIMFLLGEKFVFFLVKFDQHLFSLIVVTSYADYYIIAGVVYQAPDLGSVINSRLVRKYLFIVVL